MWLIHSIFNINYVFLCVFFTYFNFNFYFSCSCLVLVLLMLLKTFFVCPPACRRRLFFSWKNDISEKMIFLKMRKNMFLSKMIKNTTFELLDHHHELNQKKLILLKLFMLKIDSTMLKLWSIPFFSCIFLQFSTPCTFWMSNIFLNV